jgi:hypothetical protein
MQMQLMPSATTISAHISSNSTCSFLFNFYIQKYKAICWPIVNLAAQQNL